MRNLIYAVALVVVSNVAMAEFVTVLPVKGNAINNVIPEILSLSEQYGKTTTLRYWLEDSQKSGTTVLSNTNINPSNGLTSSMDMLTENTLFGFYVGAAQQTGYSTEPVSGTVLALSNSEDNFNNSNGVAIALAARIASQADSDYATLETVSGTNSNVEADNTLLALSSDSSSSSNLVQSNSGSIMDTLLSGLARTKDYELPASVEQILISGMGGAILNNGGGSGVGLNADGVPAPEPSTMVMMLIGFLSLVWYRRKTVKQ